MKACIEGLKGCVLLTLAKEKPSVEQVQVIATHVLHRRLQKLFGIPDDCEVGGGMADDCNGNGQLDSCEIAAGEVEDGNGDGVPDSCQCVFDLDGDGDVGGGDVGIFLGLWGTTDPAADFDGDGVVRAADLGLLLAAFGPCP